MKTKPKSAGVCYHLSLQIRIQKNHFRRKHRFLRTDHFLQLVPFLLTVSTCTVPRISSLYSSSATFFFSGGISAWHTREGEGASSSEKLKRPPFPPPPWRTCVRGPSVRLPGVRTPLHQHRV